MRSIVEMEMFFMALSDKTRLRLLNLMRNDEICVCFFTEILGESQPKISRHLAYLRNAGLVDARRDGKWMHYSIAWPEETGARRVLEEALDWLSRIDTLAVDRERYEAVCCSPEALVQIAKTPVPITSFRAVPRGEELPDVRDDYRHSHNELEEFLL